LEWAIKAVEIEQTPDGWNLKGAGPEGNIIAESELGHLFDLSFLLCFRIEEEAGDAVFYRSFMEVTSPTGSMGTLPIVVSSDRLGLTHTLDPARTYHKLQAPIVFDQGGAYKFRFFDDVTTRYELSAYVTVMAIPESDEF
jgi:hypothetical protein